MIVSGESNTHLTYCLNIHPGESWAECRAAIGKYALKVRDLVAAGEMFGLGLRLSNLAAEQLSDSGELAEFKSFLRRNNLYVTTVNAFPFGEFHAAPVKDQVYAPDWRDSRRVDYTRRVARILAELLPPGMDGSINTVPCSYRAWIKSQVNLDLISGNLLQTAGFLAELEEESGRRIMLALEPEPDCLLDDIASTVGFFNNELETAAAALGIKFDWRRYVGICLDTCHASVAFESPLVMLRTLLDNGITIAKIHLSAALRTVSGPCSATQLASFNEHTYLHQTRIRHSDGSIACYPDLSDDLLHGAISETGSEVRVHMHVPLYFAQHAMLQSTVGDLSTDFFRAVMDAGIPLLEIETYTYDVLPPELRTPEITESVAREFFSVMRAIRAD